MSILAFILGLIIGSFLNSVIYRLHEGGNIAKERSHCPKCSKILSWTELIPLLSFIFQRGICRRCKQKISWQYPLVEFFTAALYLSAFLIRDPQISSDYLLLLRDFIFIAFLAIIFVYDLRWKLIPDKVTVPAMIISIIFIWLLGNFGLILVHIGAGLAAGGFFLAQFLASGGRWIGGGDIRLGFLMGLMLGWPGILAALFISYVSGAIISVGLVISSKKKWSSQIAFGTFLSFGTLVTLFCGPQLI